MHCPYDLKDTISFPEESVLNLNSSNLSKMHFITVAFLLHIPEMLFLVVFLEFPQFVPVSKLNLSSQTPVVIVCISNEDVT